MALSTKKRVLLEKFFLFVSSYTEVGGNMQSLNKFTAETSDLAHALVAQLKHMPSGWQQLQVEFPVEMAFPLFAAQREGVRFAWRGRGEQKLVLGWGQARAYHALRTQEIAKCLQDLRQDLATAPAEIRAYGGIAFPDEGVHPRSLWQQMEGLRLIIPRFEIHVQGHFALLKFNFFASGSFAQDQILLEQAFAHLKAPLKASPITLPTLRPCWYEPDYPRWLQQIQAVKHIFAQQVLKKIVLARASFWQTEQSLSALSLLTAMLSAQHAAYLYFFLWPDQSLFAGLSPERLYIRQASQIETEALAGTQRTPLEPLPQQSENKLLQSAKNRYEHQLVREFLEMHLRAWCQHTLRTGPLQLVHSGPVQHLYQVITGELLTEVSDFELLQALHPTPAVAGLPRAQALQALKSIQNLQRGWYSGAIGWLNAQGAEFSVALRCLLAQQNRICFWTGAGIVPDSDPEYEWEELNLKQQTLLQYFNSQSHPNTGLLA